MTLIMLVLYIHIRSQLVYILEIGYFRSWISIVEIRHTTNWKSDPHFKNWIDISELQKVLNFDSNSTSYEFYYYS